MRGGWAHRIAAFVVATGAAAVTATGATYAINGVTHRSPSANLPLTITDTTPPPAVVGTPIPSGPVGSTAGSGGPPNGVTYRPSSGPPSGGAGDGGGEPADAGLGLNTTAVSGLYPGASRPLQLTLTNPYAFAITVHHLGAILVATSVPDCAVSPVNLVVGDFSGQPPLPLVLAAREQRSVGTVPLFMPNTVAESCQHATFTIRLLGSATKA
jgi:hypothetical protein